MHLLSRLIQQGAPEKYCTRARETVATALLLSPLPPLVVFALCLLTYAYLWHLEL